MTLQLPDWGDVPEHCGQEVPGVGADNDRVMDLSARATTEDQQRIEAVLDGLIAPGQRLLHVGVGNSSLARRFCDRTGGILGLTLSDAECSHANGLGIDGYHTRIVNKYSSQMDTVDGPFDMIIDNNPASFCCCVTHFELMLQAYVRLLTPGGLMVTDRQGMFWCYANGPMRLRFEDLEIIAAHYPFAAERFTDDVFALRRREN